MTILAFLAELDTVWKGLAVAGKLAVTFKGVILKIVNANKDEKFKDDVAVIIDFLPSSAEGDVRRYLEAKRIDATICICENPDDSGFLDINDKDSWENATRGIYATLTTIAKASPKRVHIFLSCPAALAFAIGNVARQTCNPYVYQHNTRRSDDAASSIYSMVLRANDSLREKNG